MEKCITSIFLIVILTISSCLQSPKESCKKQAEIVTLKWANCFADTVLHKKLGIINAEAFSKLCPEEGIPLYLKANPAKQDTDTKTLIEENRDTLVKYSRQKMINLWNNNKKEYGSYKEGTEKSQCFPVVAFEQGKPIGFAFFCNSTEVFFGKNTLAENEVILGRIAISPKAQGRGLSRKLIFSILNRFPNTTKIILNTDITPDIVTGRPKNEHACKVYEHYGFERYIETRVGPYDPKKKQYFQKIIQKKNK
ncbi:GNAT family N-acetyltransferase [Candidatus Dependentiae bacterium]